MWPVYAAGCSPRPPSPPESCSGSAGARRAAIACAVAVGVFAVAGGALYGATEARYRSCVDRDKGLSEDSEVAVSGYHWCHRRVFGGVRGETIP